MQIITTIGKQDWAHAQPWLNTVLDKTESAQVIVYNQMDGHVPMHHERLGFWDMQEHVLNYQNMVKDVNSRFNRAMSVGARTRIWQIWNSYVRDICIADFMMRSPYEFAWCQATAWPEYTLNSDWLHHQLHTNDCVLWNHQGAQRTDLMLLGGSHALRRMTADRIIKHYATGIQWLNRNPNIGWQYWLQDWQRRVIEGDDSWQFY